MAIAVWMAQCWKAPVRAQAPKGQPAKSRRSQRVVPLPEIQVTSPDGKVRFNLLPDAERLRFKATLADAAVIEESPLAMKLDGYDLSSGVAFGKLERYEIRESYRYHGPRSMAANHCNGARIELTHDLSFTPYTLDVRVFDDGIAYRHVVPGEASAARVPDECSTFIVPAGSTVWYHDLDGHYEAEYSMKGISEVRAGEWAGPPLTFKLPGGAGYASITEANLVNYSGMALESDGRRGWVIGLGHRQPLNYPFELRYGREEGGRLGRPAAVTGEIATPWRVVMIGRDLNALVNSTILPNLCPPPDPALFPEGLATGWIRPGRAVWRYLDGGPTGVEGMKEFSRMAGLLGFEHHVIEGFWSKWTPEERKKVVEYSRRQGVGLWFWKHSNQLRTPEAREEFFRILADLGVVGAKIDFFDHEAKEVVDLYEALLRKAAEHRIMLVFHGSNKPTGRERTWPNELVRESVRGMEASRLAERARHQTILPFTRYLAGPADYTTLIFSERRRDSSPAHQIASMVVFASPLLTIAANPQSLLDSPAVEMIKSVPSAWDETIVLPDSDVGRLAAYVRRKGDTWFLAAICGPEARSVRVPLTFLGEGGYGVLTVGDNKQEAAALKIENTTQTHNAVLSIDLSAGGGYIARFSRLK